MFADKPPAAGTKKRGGSVAIGVLAVIALLVIVGIAVGSDKDPAPTAATITSTTPAPTAWAPAGWIEANRVIAIRWPDDAECDAQGAPGCWVLDVLVNQSCDLYVEANLYDAAGVIVDRDNDTRVLPSGAQARIVFRSYDATANTARLARAECS